jgi:hypothetical protein
MALKMLFFVYMEQMLMPKLEKKTISKEEVLEKNPKLFEPIGSELVRSGGRVEIENENIKISLRYDDVRFRIDNLPKNEEELSHSNLYPDERQLLKFLNFKPEDFYELRYFLIENKNDFNQIELEEYDTRQTRIFVLKDGSDVDGSSAHSLEDYIRLNAEPKTVAALLIAFHEIGHRKDPNISIRDAYAQRDSVEDNQVENKKMLDRERYAWAYSLSTLKPFLTGMNADLKDVNAFIHERCLGSYSDFIKNNQ